MITDVVVKSNRLACEAALSEALDNAVTEVSELIEREAMRQLGSLIYETPESPSYKRTGHLKRSLRQKKTGHQKAKVENDAEYAVFVHEGTRRMSPRPFLENSRRRIVPKIPDVVADALKKLGF